MLFLDIVFDEKTGEIHKHPPRSANGKQSTDATADMVAQILAKVIAACRTREVGAGFRRWEKRRSVVNGSDSDAQNSGSDNGTAKTGMRHIKVVGKEYSLIFRDVGIAGLNWRPFKEVEVGIGELQGSVCTTYNSLLGLRLGIGAILRPSEESLDMMLTLSKRIGPIQIDTGISRSDNYFEKSLKNVHFTHGLRLEVANFNVDQLSVLPGLIPSVRWPWRRQKKDNKKENTGHAAETEMKQEDSPTQCKVEENNLNVSSDKKNL